MQLQDNARDVKDLLIGWPVTKLEKLFFKNSQDACGIIFKIQKKQV
jgi:hypothetical protein